MCMPCHAFKVSATASCRLHDDDNYIDMRRIMASMAANGLLRARAAAICIEGCDAGSRAYCLILRAVTPRRPSQVQKCS